MKALSKEHKKTIIAAFIGAVVAVVVSPFAETLSFMINQHLARPILSIEYVEIVPDEQQLTAPTKELQTLLESEGYRRLLMNGIGGGAATALMAYQGQARTVAVDELEAMKAATDTCANAIKRRLAQLAEFATVLSSQPTDAQVREIRERYQGAMPSMHPDQTAAGLLESMDIETRQLNQSAGLARALHEALSTVSAPTAQSGKLKLSVLNRGSNDGLVRHMGDLSLMRNGLVLPMRRVPPPESKPVRGAIPMAIPVAVTNPAADTDRATSVGKVEAHSMAEFWFEADTSATSVEERHEMWTLFGEGTGEIQVRLYDQYRQIIPYRMSLSGKKTS